MSKHFLEENELNKILNTLFESDYGLFYRRGYNISNNTPVTINGMSMGVIKNILDESYIQDNMTNINKTEKKNSYIIKIDKYTVILKKTFEKKDLELENDTILINFEKKNINGKYFFTSEQLLFNLSKNKYVPHIELMNETNNIEIDKIAKIKNTDPLIKFYGFNKGDVCKIIYKSNKINNINLYFNYRLII
jgi:DNA-directed RNA polymerase subunit H (RpoH/RPB5)|tara:strand:- start:485 stop:1060 length:576 start_codon:yes stop_codon:yes gene_type:complete